MNGILVSSVKKLMMAVMLMNKKALAQDMKRVTGGSFITRKELTSYLNLKDPKSVDPYLFDLPAVNQRFFIDDVADAIISQCKWR